jgi:DNA-damage-inducible protein J
MPKTIANPLVRARVAPQRKRRAEAILASLGINPGQAINMLYAQIELKKGLPFPVVTEDNSDLLLPLRHRQAALSRLDEP